MKKILLSIIVTVAAAVTVSSPIRSMLGSDGAKFTPPDDGRDYPTDYVTDGLIHYWDGIENAGWGEHDPNAMIWTDLVGDMDLTLTTDDKSYMEFETNCLVCKKKRCCGDISKCIYRLHNM